MNALAINPKTKNPTLLLTANGDIVNAAGAYVHTFQARAEICGNFAGEPTKLALEEGIIRKNWPYLLWNETKAEFTHRLAQTAMIAT